jgi:DNA-binding transcriptional regulator YiaG
MALSPSLHSVDLTFACPHCGHPLVRPGRWFKVAKGFKCNSCKSDIRLTYSARVALFDGYRGSVPRAAIASDGGRGRIWSRQPATQSTELGVSKFQFSREIEEKKTLTGEQVRAARELLGWSPKRLADEAALSVKALEAFEEGRERLLLLHKQVLRDVLERAGARFFVGKPVTIKVRGLV